MIQNLIRKINDLLLETLAGEIPNVAQHIKANQIQPSAGVTPPLVLLIPGNFAIATQPGEGTSTSPHSEEVRQKIAVNDALPQGPYVLGQTPLSGSARCKVFFDENSVTEKQIWLQENRDFTINYATRSCSFSYDLTGADIILFIYSVVSISTLRNFAQDLFIDVHGNNAAEVEKFTSLVAGNILAYHDSLLLAGNQDNAYKTEYQAGGVSTRHHLTQIQLIEGQPDPTAIPKTRLKFTVSGHLKSSREITEGFGLIEKIHSPGKVSTQAVDIVVQVE